MNVRRMKVAAVAIAVVAAAAVLVLVVRGRGDAGAGDGAAKRDAKAPRTLESLRRHHFAWAYYEGAEAKAHRAELAAFDLVVLSPAAADRSTVKWLRDRGCEVAVSELKGGASVEDGRTCDYLAEFDGGLCWLGFDFESMRKGSPRAAEYGRTLARLREMVRANPKLKILALADSLPAGKWNAFREMCHAVRMLPYVKPDNVNEVNGDALAAASNPPRDGYKRK